MAQNLTQARQRQAAISQMLQQHHSVSSTDLAEHFGVNAMTIRRDLGELEKQGVALRCYGGAVPAKRAALEIRFDRQRQTHQQEKQRIGQAAAALIEPDQTVFLDTGTTTLEVAGALMALGLTCRVITSSLAIASQLWGSETARLTLLGGDTRAGSPDLAGPVTEWVLDKLAADVAIVGADAIDPNRGFFAGSADVARIAQQMVAHAQRAIVVADATKLTQRRGAKYASFEDVDQWITDRSLASSDLRSLRRKVKISTH